MYSGILLSNVLQLDIKPSLPTRLSPGACSHSMYKGATVSSLNPGFRAFLYVHQYVSLSTWYTCMYISACFPVSVFYSYIHVYQYVRLSAKFRLAAVLWTELWHCISLSCITMTLQCKNSTSMPVTCHTSRSYSNETQTNYSVPNSGFPMTVKLERNVLFSLKDTHSIIIYSGFRASY